MTVPRSPGVAHGRIPRNTHHAALALLLLAVPLRAQDSAAAPAPIRDNSFLVEEAYNQERDVIQHIATFQHATTGSDWTVSFTQEWPVGGRRHQISFTLVGEHRVIRPNVDLGERNVLINYREQSVGGAGSRLAVAPRASLVIPARRSSYARNIERIGLAFMVPLSVELTPTIVTHSNAGATVTPRAYNSSGQYATTVDFALNQSAVWLARPRFNVLLEAAYASKQTVTGSGGTARRSSLFLSPGVRTALDFSSGLQIVPGLAFPIGVGSSSDERAAFLYLSFEHPL